MNISKLSFAIIIAIAFTTSCVEKSNKYKAVVSQRDSIFQSEQQLKSEYDQVLEMIEDIESKFQTIREVENQVFIQIDNGEVNKKTKKEIISAQVSQIQNILEENKTRIEELENKLKGNNSKIATLNKTINRLQDELNKKSVLVEALQQELSRKDFRIKELTAAVTSLSENNENLKEIATTQQQTLEDQDAELNTVWYVVGDSKKLKSLDIIKTNGIFKPSTINDKELDKSKFTQVDLRKLRAIETKSKTPRLLSVHPRDSYTLSMSEDKVVYVEILDPASFWSVTKYLVIKE